MKNLLITLIISLALLGIGCGGDNSTTIPPEEMQIVALRIGTESIIGGDNVNVPVDAPLVITFSVALDRSTVDENITLVDENNEEKALEISYLDSDKTISAQHSGLQQNHNYQVIIGDGIKGIEEQTFSGVSIDFTTVNPPLAVLKAFIDEREVATQNRIKNIELLPEIKVHFSEPVSASDIESKVFLTSRFNTITPDFTEVSDSVFIFSVDEDLEDYEKYRFYLSSTIEYDDKEFEGYEFEFYTELDSTLKFPEITDDELLTKVQEQTFKYFWDFGHPVSGLTRERNTSGEVVTSGGSGFGVMAIIVAIERGFITRQEGVDRLEKIVGFLGSADRFHGAWSHWLNGTSGDAIPFSSNDDGGDLVETAFMIQGLITARQYLDDQITQEADLIDDINNLWEAVEWDWYTQGGQNVLYWHWSPNFDWEKNHKITGWNEALIIYVLAASSPSHTISKDVYDEGWAQSGGMVNSSNASYYGYTLDLRSDRGGPLFFSHYSFLGLDPRNLEDQYANYWDQNVNHSLINQAYCVQNPKGYIGYNPVSWGLTASDNHEGYSAHSPDNDLGVITPTAAISSLPYTPEESMDAIRHFYYILGDRIWGEYGFYDAFNPTEGWYADSYLAIDQGPIICMIENHRTELLWDLFMSAPEVQAGLDKLGFTY